MTVFMLNTDSVTGSADSLNTIANNVKETKNSVSGYDTSNEDGFDFATAKTSIANNLDACATKVSNTMNVLKSVVSSHTNLQNGMKFESSPSEEPNNNPQETNSQNNYLNYDNNGGYNGSSSYGGYVGYGGVVTEPETVNLFETPLFASLITAGLFNIIEEKDLEDKIKDQTTLVIKANSKEKKDQEYIAMVTEIAIANKIPVTFVETTDKESTISLVKNGKVLKELEGYQEEKTIKKMFEEYKDTLADTKEDTESKDEKADDADEKENVEAETKTIVTEQAKSILYKENNSEDTAKEQTA